MKKIIIATAAAIMLSTASMATEITSNTFIADNIQSWAQRFNITDNAHLYNYHARFRYGDEFLNRSALFINDDVKKAWIEGHTGENISVNLSDDFINLQR